MSKPNRTPWIDNARAAAVVGVLVIHVAAAPVLVSDHSASWWAVNLYDSASRWSVPVFFLLSGMLLLDPVRDESAADFYRKRMAKVGIPLVFWTALYAGLFVVRRQLSGSPATPMDVADRVMTGQAHFHLWYLYAIVPMYLLTPALRTLIRAVPAWAGAALAASLFVASAAELLLRGSYGITAGPVWIWWALYLPWFFVAPFWTRLDPERGRGVAWAVALGGVVATALGCGWWSQPGVLGAGHYFYVYLSATTIPTSLAVFHLMRGWSEPVLAPERLQVVGRTSLGVYLLHPALLDALRFAGLRAENLYPAVSVPVLVAALLVVSVAVVDRMQQIPVLKRTV